MSQPKTIEAVTVDRIPTEDQAPTVPLLFAARVAFGMGRTAAYKAHRDGTFPLEVIPAGGQLFVRTRDLRELLRLDDGPAQPP